MTRLEFINSVFNGYDGWEVWIDLRCRRFTEDLILKGFADFIATDAHSHKIRSNRILDKIEYFPESITEDMLKALLEDAPLRVLKDEAFPEKEVEYF